MAKTKDGIKKSQVWLTVLKGNRYSRLYGYIYDELSIYAGALANYNKAELPREFRALEESFINSAISEYHDIYLHHTC